MEKTVIPDSVVDLFGVGFDQQTGETYYNGEKTPYTFERSFLNPNFATSQTAVAIWEACRIRLDLWSADANLKAELVSLHSGGLGNRPVERSIRVSNGSLTEHYNCGLLALMAIKRGEAGMFSSWRAELRASGFQVL